MNFFEEQAKNTHSVPKSFKNNLVFHRILINLVFHASQTDSQASQVSSPLLTSPHLLS